MFDEILTFWFKKITPQKWWTVDPVFDELVRTRFFTLLQQAVAGELFEWRTSTEGRLAEIIILDQFSRNIYRGTPQAFAQDPQALSLSQEAVVDKKWQTLDRVKRSFLLMPYMHSESRLIHIQAEALFKQFADPGNYEFELRHKTIIDRFGRYPHRNQILGRISSEAEIEFLKQPNSSF